MKKQFVLIVWVQAHILNTMDIDLEEKNYEDALSKTREEFHRLLTDHEVNIDL